MVKKMNDTLRNQYVTKRDVINEICFDCLHGDLDVDRCYNFPCAEIEAVMRMPVTQPEVIRCHECKHVQHDEMFYQYWCNGNRVNPDHFCGYAERKDDE